MREAGRKPGECGVPEASEQSVSRRPTCQMILASPNWELRRDYWFSNMKVLGDLEKRSSDRKVRANTWLQWVQGDWKEKNQRIKKREFLRSLLKKEVEKWGGICRKSRIKRIYGASLVAQWLRICLPMQGTRVWALVWEDPTCRGATGPVSHNYWACASGACAPQQERPWQWEARAPRWRAAPACHY